MSIPPDNSCMKSVIPPDVMADLQSAVDNVIKGVHDPEAKRAAAERMDRMREELRQRHGEMEIAVNLVRESRDEDE